MFKCCGNCIYLGKRYFKDNNGNCNSHYSYCINHEKSHMFAVAAGMECELHEFDFDKINLQEEKRILNMKIRGFERVESSLENIVMPKRATAKSAGYDFYLPYDVFIHSKSCVTIKTGVKAYMRDDEVLK